LVFVVLEGFSGTGKTTLAMALEGEGWLRLVESAHAVPKEVPVAERADTAADYSLVGATMTYSSLISRRRKTSDVVAEGYLLSDLAYAKIRHGLGKSSAFPHLMALARAILSEPELRPDLYIMLRAKPETIDQRQVGKDERERNISEVFRSGYYEALEQFHAELGQGNVETVFTDSDVNLTLQEVKSAIGKRQAVA
jgi:thymidylate kinase